MAPRGARKNETRRLDTTRRSNAGPQRRPSLLNRRHETCEWPSRLQAHDARDRPDDENHQGRKVDASCGTTTTGPGLQGHKTAKTRTKLRHHPQGRPRKRLLPSKATPTTHASPVPHATAQHDIAPTVKTLCPPTASDVPVQRSQVHFAAVGVSTTSAMPTVPYAVTPRPPHPAYPAPSTTLYHHSHSSPTPSLHIPAHPPTRTGRTLPRPSPKTRGEKAKETEYSLIPRREKPYDVHRALLAGGALLGDGLGDGGGVDDL
ncbi:hypothetical protein C8J57DRAFT_1509277 [Mycena rebaudengoi]|nr:hypothetical protein C8J57DRAFT_1509277 [Mycena rebaudengoi]